MRIERVLNKLKKLWNEFPDQRLGQLLDNCIYGYKSDSHTFYMEDDIVEEKLDMLLKENILIEELAELMHNQWSTWVRHFLEFENPNTRKEWETKSHALYGHLSDDEKEAHRQWARKVVDLFKESNE